jgi:hypothetical protein
MGRDPIAWAATKKIRHDASSLNNCLRVIAEFRPAAGIRALNTI